MLEIEIFTLTTMYCEGRIIKTCISVYKQPVEWPFEFALL